MTECSTIATRAATLFTQSSSELVSILNTGKGLGCQRNVCLAQKQTPVPIQVGPVVRKARG